MNFEILGARAVMTQPANSAQTRGSMAANSVGVSPLEPFSFRVRSPARPWTQAAKAAA